MTAASNGGSPAQQPAPECVGQGVAVSFDYKLYDVAGRLVEASGPGEQLDFIVGIQPLPAPFAAAIAGLRLGACAKLTLPPEEAFGRRDEEAIIHVDRSELPAEAKVGDEFEAERDDGSTVFMRVVGLDSEAAELDLNHPLASQSIKLELTVAGLRHPSAGERREAERAQALPNQAGGCIPAWALVRGKQAK